MDGIRTDDNAIILCEIRQLEAFECEGGGAEEGKFGYYLRKVEL